MSQLSKLLTENIYALLDQRPTRDDGDDNGNVLYYKPAHGWYTGYWSHAYMDGTTHWTYLPVRPPIEEDPALIRDARFEEWLRTFPTKFEDSVIALFRLGWNAGWNRARS